MLSFFTAVIQLNGSMKELKLSPYLEVCHASHQPSDASTPFGFHLTSMFSLQCSDIVGWATGRASSLKKTGCWFAVGDILTGALHIL